MPTLKVPSAELYYETLGSGPLLLCISGANGSVDIWRLFSQELQHRFTVAMYDRRGFSRSILTGPQDYAGSHRIETDTDDAKALIQHLSPDEPATVIGNSSGAVVSLMLLQRHPEVIRTLICHEPPAESLLEDQKLWRGRQQDVYDTYRAGGPAPAMAKFIELVHASSDSSFKAMASADPRSNPYIAGNTMYWFEREFMAYVFQEFDLEKLGAQKEKLILANGKESHHEAPQYLCNMVLGEKLGLEVKWFTGGHIAFGSGPQLFAEELKGLLKGRDEVYGHL